MEFVGKLGGNTYLALVFVPNLTHKTSLVYSR